MTHARRTHALDPPRISNLPAAHTPFIGRQQDLEAICRRLHEPECRLLTLVGLGGVGKTRLAVQSARQVENAFTDGICYVPLETVQSEPQLVSSILDSLALSAGAVDPRAYLLRFLRDKSLLLVLDNFEHLLDNVALLTDILAAAPQVKILVTSRQVLNLQEEHRHPIQGMAHPSQVDDEKLLDFDAVRLFVKQAQRVRPDFVASEEAADVVRICQQVDGLPLAIELAAAWASSLTCAEIADEIGRDLAILSSTRRNAAAHHRSMQVVFDRSWRVLGENDRTLFASLSVFRGGFQREAATKVVGATIPALTRLLDQSLLQREETGRYRIHELLRQYAEERLQQDPVRATETAARHAGYFARWLEERLPALESGDQAAAAAEIERDVENVRRAWRWAVTHEDSAACGQALYAMTWFYQFKAHYREGADTLAEAIQMLESRAEPAERLLLARVLGEYGLFCLRLGQLEDAKRAFDRNYAIYEELHALPPHVSGTDPLALQALMAETQGAYAEAARLGEVARQRSAARGDARNAAFALYIETNAALARGELETAWQLAQRTHAAVRENGNRWFMAYTLNNVGKIAWLLGDDESAERHFRASYAVREEFHDREGMALALRHLGDIAVRRHDVQEAAVLYARSVELYRETGDQGGRAAALAGMGRAAALQGNFDDACARFHQALQIVADIQLLPLTLAILAGIGEMFVLAGQPERAAVLLTEVREHAATDSELHKQVQTLPDQRDIQPVSQQLHPATLPSKSLADTVSLLLSELAVPSALQRSAPSSAPAPKSVDGQAEYALLTPREFEVLHLLAAGLSNQQIADRLVVTLSTVKTHTNRLYSKLDVRNRVQAIAAAQALGLVQLPGRETNE